jgi:hypothetical protein
MTFFTKTYWTKPICASTLCALFAGWCVTSTCKEQKKCEAKDTSEAEFAVTVELKDSDKLAQLSNARTEVLVLKKRLHALEQNLNDILVDYKKQKKKYERLKLSIASSLDAVTPTKVNDKQMELLKILNRLVKSGNALAVNNIEFTYYVKKLMQTSSLSSLEKARLNLKIEQLKTASIDFSRLTDVDNAQNVPRECQIYNVNDDLQIIVLSAGYVQGIRAGLIVYAGDKGQTKLEVVAVRPYVSAAIVISGSLSNLAPGVKVFINKVYK